MSSELADRLEDFACGSGDGLHHHPPPALLSEAAQALRGQEQRLAELKQWQDRGEELLRDADNIKWFRLGVWWTERPWRKQ